MDFSKSQIEGLEVKTENFDSKCLCILAYNKKKVCILLNFY